MAMVITWVTSSGATVDITPEQQARLEAAGVWPRDDRGEEYAQVMHGLHEGLESFEDHEIDAMCRGEA